MKIYKLEIEIELELKDWDGFISIDMSGDIYQYDVEPVKNKCERVWDQKGKKCVFIYDLGNPYKDWENSLIDLSKQKQ